MKLYTHYSSKNHGCEAIVRGTSKIVGKKMTLFSEMPDDDEAYGLSEIVDLEEDCISSIKKKSIHNFVANVQTKFTGSELLKFALLKKDFMSKVKKNDIYLSIGGDNYCYTGIEKLSYMNYLLKKRGAKTVLWGCSIDPDKLDKYVVRDLKRYDLIIVRESLSESAFHEVGITETVFRFPDPAFQLDACAVEYSVDFQEKGIIGINLSPLIINCENKDQITMNNYIKLVEYILENTSFNIALIPHVVIDGNDDREPLRVLLSKFEDSGRVIMVDDGNAEVLKGYISKCDFFIGARTHSTIAAYSSCIPTLVVGYSIKARGIANDIFGTEHNYVLPVQDLEEEDSLVKAFKWLYTNQRKIKKHLNDFMPHYKADALKAGLLLDELGIK